jgi:hypothetical protein
MEKELKETKQPEKFVPYEKMSKKAQKEYLSKHRKDWGVFNPWLRGVQEAEKKEKKSAE